MSDAAREGLIAELLGLPAQDLLGEQHRAEALAWARSGASLWRTAKPATPPMHLVSYVLPVDADGLLLLDHRNAGLWLPPGGHVEPGEAPQHCAARELREELGVEAFEVGAPLMVTITQTVGQTAGHTDVSLWYPVALSRTLPLSVDPAEASAAQWFAWDALPLHRTDPHLARFAALWHSLLETQ